jgi:hypothetical protein
MDDEFGSDERLYRKVRPLAQFWDAERQRPTSGAFKDKDGLSVDRQGQRQNNDAISQLNRRLPLDGAIVSLEYQEATKIPVLVMYKPLLENEFHSEIYDSPDKVTLSLIKARALAQVVRIDQLPSYSK